MVNADGRRAPLGGATGLSEAEPFWTGFLRSLADRGLRGVKLVVAALMLEQNDEWTVQRRNMSLEHLARFGDGEPVRLPAVAT